MNDLVIKKCIKCGAVVEVLHDCICADCGIQCCGQPMVTLNPNTTDAAFEKHIPTYEVQENKILAMVNHVMEPQHYIEWIALVGNHQVYKRNLTPQDKPEAVFPYIKGAKLYSYCNKHALWVKEVE